MTPRRKEEIHKEIEGSREEVPFGYVFSAYSMEELLAELEAVEQERDLALSDTSVKHKYRADVLERRCEEYQKSCDLLRRRVEGLRKALEFYAEGSGRYEDDSEYIQVDGHPFGGFDSYGKCANQALLADDALASTNVSRN